MNQSQAWHEPVLLALPPLLLLLFIPSLSNAFLIKQPITTALAFAALGLATLRPGLRSPIPVLCWAAGLLYLTAAFRSAVTASNPSLAMEDCLLQLALLDTAFLGAAGAFSPTFPLRFAKVALVSSIGMSLLGIAQGFFPEQLNFDLQALGKMKAFSTLGNPNFVACLLVGILPWAWFLFRRETSKPLKTLWAACGVLGLLCLIQTDSRSGWLALAFGALVFAYTHLKEGSLKRLIPWGVLAVLLAAMAVGLFTHSGLGRFMIWAESLGIWKTHPLGVGFENYNIHQLQAQRDFFEDPAHVRRYLQNASFTFDAHNEALTLLVEVGPFGLIGWLALVAMAAWRGFQKAAKDEWSRALLAGWSGMLFFSLWNTVFFYAPLGFFFWMQAGFLMEGDLPPGPQAGRRGLAGLANGPQAASQGVTVPNQGAERKRGATVGLAIVFFALSLDAAFKGVQGIRAGLLEHQADILLSTGPFDQDADLYRQALALDPSNGFAWQKLGLALYFDNHYPEALDCLAKARPLYGDIANPYLNAEILAREKRYDEAIQEYRFIAGAFPNHVTPPFMLGQIYLKLGKKEEARAQFQRVLDIPESPYNLRLDRGKVEKQKELAKEFLKRL